MNKQGEDSIGPICGLTPKPSITKNILKLDNQTKSKAQMDNHLTNLTKSYQEKFPDSCNPSQDFCIIPSFLNFGNFLKFSY